MKFFLYRTYSTCTILSRYFAYNSIKLLYYIMAIIAQVSDVANGFLFIIIDWFLKSGTNKAFIKLKFFIPNSYLIQNSPSPYEWRRHPHFILFVCRILKSRFYFIFWWSDRGPCLCSQLDRVLLFIS